MKTVIYSKVGQNRGRLRIWVEGNRLAAAGVTPGDRFRIEPDAQCIRMVFDPTGPHAVSRRVRRGHEIPVIDVCNQRLQTIFGADDRVRVVIKDGLIEVTLHHQLQAQRERENRTSQAMVAGAPLKIGSLAHGGGVLDHAIHEGLRDAGVRSTLAFANEIEPEYLEASLSNNPVWSEDSIAVLGGMQEVEWRRLPKVDILLAGLPCTGASLAGRAKNGLKHAEEHPEAGALFVAFLNAITALNPSVVVLENVCQFSTTTSMTVIRSVLDELGYAVQETTLRGADFGAIEHRDRMCMVASSKGLPFPSLEQVRKPAAITRRLGEILDDVPLDDPSWRAYGYLNEKETRDRAAGKGFRRQLVTPASTEVGTVGRGYAKVRSTEPHLAHPSGDGRSRLLTPAEHARIKTIPEQLVAGCSSTTAHEILGQSVIHRAFVAVGHWMGCALQSITASTPAVFSPLARAA